LAEDVLHPVQEPVGLAQHDGLEQPLLGAELVVQGLPGHRGAPRDVGHPHARPAAGHDRAVGGVQQPLADAAGARRAGVIGSGGHTAIVPKIGAVPGPDAAAGGPGATDATNGAYGAQARSSDRPGRGAALFERAAERYRYTPWRPLTTTCVWPTSSRTRPTTCPCSASAPSTCVWRPNRT